MELRRQRATAVPTATGATRGGQVRSENAILGCASTAQVTSGGRTHPRRLLVELGSLRAPEPGNRLGWSLAIKLTYGK